jgi:hypothetical protein
MPTAPPEYHGWQSWAGPAPAEPGPAPYWSAGYWSAGYWSPSYWGRAAAPAAPPAPSLIAAVKLRLIADVGDRLDGGIFNDSAPPRVSAPYLILEEGAERRTPLTTDRDVLDEGTFLISSYENTRVGARELDAAVAGSLYDAPLRIAAARLLYLRPDDRPNVERVAGLLPGERQGWRQTRTYRYVVQGEV